MSRSHTGDGVAHASRGPQRKAWAWAPGTASAHGSSLPIVKRHGMIFAVASARDYVKQCIAAMMARP